MSQEYSPLTGNELYTKRVEAGGTAQSLEKFGGISALLLAAASAALCIVEGLKTHPEHIVMSVVIVFAALQFFFIAREYQKDLLQDRKIVYISCVVLILLSTAGLVYATGWKDCPNAFSDCEDGYLSPEGTCVRLAPSFQRTPHPICYSMSQTAEDRIAGRLLYTDSNVSFVTCDKARQTIMTCFGVKKVNWTCPK